MTKTLKRSREVGKIDPSHAAGETTISSNSFAVTLFRGNGKAYSLGVGFNPSLTWIKNRVQTDNHKLIDSIRGATRVLSSNLSTTGSAEAVDAAGLTSFDGLGFTLGSGANGFNDALEDFVAYSWKEDIANGFDIITYTGTGAATTIPHNLGVMPNLIIIKNRSSATAWGIYHGSISTPNTRSLAFSTAVPATTTYWNNTLPTDTVFSLGTDTQVNANTSAYVAYVFAAVAGKSAFGTYTGNANFNGPIVNIGFQPKLVIIKRVDATGAWVMIDSLRGGARSSLANDTSVESTALSINFLTNGFQPITTATAINANGGTYIYSAWA